MSVERIVFHGRIYIAVSDAASCYGLQVAELEHWVAAELIEPPARVGGVSAWPAPLLDRIATLVRYTRLFGLDASTVRTLMELEQLEL